MSLIEQIKRRAAAAKKHVVLPEGCDARVVEAASILAREGIVKVTLLGSSDQIEGARAQSGADLAGVNLVDPATSPDRERYAELLYELRKSKGMTLDQARETLLDIMYYGTVMVKAGDADGLVAGAQCTTADTLRPGLQIIKTAPGVSTVSSSFLMILPNKEYGDDGVMMFADCAINIDPTPAQLADIAIASAQTGIDVAGISPRVAMLSYSTKGSGKGEWVDAVVEATALVRKNAPDLQVDGELQADAALVASVGQLKSPGSTVAGHANVLVFPNIQAGNIGYKLVQRLAGAEAVGPICQGFAQPVNDLSRGCCVEDVVNVTAITALQATKA